MSQEVSVRLQAHETDALNQKQRPTRTLFAGAGLRRATSLIGGASWGLSVLLSAGPSLAAPPDARDGAIPQSGPAEATPTPEPAAWRFKDTARPIKVVVLAGSIGAWPRDSYADHIESMCTQVEVKNLSKVGEGALALKQRYKRDVVANRRINLKAQGEEHWLVFQGGLNSVGTPEMTNNHIRELFVLAHRKGAHVLGLSLTPWGDDGDRRWKGAAGLRYWEYTQKVVGFVLGRLSPSDALGSYEAKRDQPGQPWSTQELPDIAVDLYDSALRAKDAEIRDIGALAQALRKESWWKKRNADVDEAARQAVLTADAARAASVPTWYLREELRSFDHIHPNAQGHSVIAAAICPTLPSNWGCQCPSG